MNTIYIGKDSQSNHFCIRFDDADKYLQMLRSDHFVQIIVDLPDKINDSQLRFMMHLSRITKPKALIKLMNSVQSQSAKTFTKLALKLGFYQNNSGQNNNLFSKQKPDHSTQNSAISQKKLSIGFKSNQKEQIDEDQLMQNQNITIQKTKVQNCAEKPKACANCNCGRKDNPQSLIPKEKLVESINQGKPVSGCGKCFLGDSFRCGSCPYKGLPAFKPGDKLKLMEQGQILVESNEVKVQFGKVKIDL